MAIKIIAVFFNSNALITFEWSDIFHVKISGQSVCHESFSLWILSFLGISILNSSYLSCKAILPENMKNDYIWRLFLNIFHRKFKCNITNCEEFKTVKKFRWEVKWVRNVALSTLRISLIICVQFVSNPIWSNG